MLPLWDATTNWKERERERKKNDGHRRRRIYSTAEQREFSVLRLKTATK